LEERGHTLEDRGQTLENRGQTLEDRGSMDMRSQLYSKEDIFQFPEMNFKLKLHKLRYIKSMLFTSKPNLVRKKIKKIDRARAVLILLNDISSVLKYRSIISECLFRVSSEYMTGSSKVKTYPPRPNVGPPKPNVGPPRLNVGPPEGVWVLRRVYVSSG
jgi:hypothetical protein